MSAGGELSEAERQAWLGWGALGWEHRHWLRRSVRAIHLFDWLREADRYTAMLGTDGYRAQMLEWLAAARPEDCAAAGLQIDGALATLVCDTVELSVHFSPRQTHRAVAWREAAWSAAQVWVDGAPLDVDADPPGYWADEDLYALAVAGPADHPGQDFSSFGGALGRVRSLLVWHARERRRSALLVPAAHEDWTQPIAVVRAGALHVHADARSAATRAADRVLPL
ncbi:hypothetical protein ACQEVB_36650 [Pseudonocardia sp. CA-107938]|uniref:hypothetical protein n=1 Tax=Pseudonocardia sp. CA-107938 TaxID=3240021 RepID=UPI003D933B3A